MHRGRFKKVRPHLSDTQKGFIIGLLKAGKKIFLIQR